MCYYQLEGPIQFLFTYLTTFTKTTEQKFELWREKKILPKEHWPTGHQANYYLSIFTSTLNIYSPASLELELELGT